MNPPFPLFAYVHMLMELPLSICERMVGDEGGEREGHHNGNVCKQGERGEFISMQTFVYNFLLIEHLVHKLLTIIIRLYTRKQS